MNLKELNHLPDPEFIDTISVCLGSKKWQQNMLLARPFGNMNELFKASNTCWYKECKTGDWIEAFAFHPMIGDLKSLKERFAGTEKFAQNEQAAVAGADETIINQLYSANMEYADKFGFIFIVSASGKSANDMLKLLQSRIQNSREDELHIAMGEQQKITQNRLKKLLSEELILAGIGSQLTTHVLDTSIGKPVNNILIKLKKIEPGGTYIISEGITNNDGRIADLLPGELVMDPGVYSLYFDTNSYFANKGIQAFYPFIEISFTIAGDEHYHVPLLLNPFGYSTYRGS